MFAVAMKWYVPQCSAEPAGHDNNGHAGAADDNGEQCNTRQPEAAKIPKKQMERGFRIGSHRGLAVKTFA